MKIKNYLKYLIILSTIIIAGCPNPMIGLGDKVDIDAPKVSIGKYGNGNPIVNGDYVKGTVTLTGSASDDIGIKEVQISFDGGKSFLKASVAASGKSWSYTVDTSKYTDGEKNIVVLVSDTSATPKTSEERLLLYFDNTPPVVMVTVSPGFASPASDSTFSLKGEATDPFRIRKVSVTLITGAGTVSPVEGTNSWSCVLSGAVTGPYKFKIIAEDYAGNKNTHFFHYNDVNSLNSGNYITIENIYKIENGGTVPGAVIDQTSLQGIELTELPLTVDMNDDVPVITISNPEVAAQLGGNAIVIGRVEDDDAVDTSTIKINIDNGGWEWDTLNPVNVITGSGQSVNFKYDISSLGNGAHTIQLKASDDHGTTKTSDPVAFTVDLGAPQIEITSPGQSEYLNSAIVSLAGTAYDDQSVQSVKVQLDGEIEANWRDASSGNGFADWSYTTPALSEGMHTAKVYAKDGTGKESSYNISFNIDITDPSVTFNYPVKSSEVYGDVTVQGICTDNSNAFQNGYIKVGKDGTWEAVSNLSHWTKTITDLEGTYTNSGSAYDLGAGVWQLPVTFKVTDIAGNTVETTETDYYFLINAALDKPEVTITYPEDAFKTGGPITVRGTSYDEQQVLRVEMRMDLNGDGDFDDSIDLNGDTDTLDPFENETQWQTVSGLGILNWQQELNGSGELFAANTGGTGTVNIEVRAVDTKDGLTDGVVGDTASIAVTFDNSYPYFDNFSHSSFDYEKGTFTLTGQAHDTELVSSILLSYNGGTSYTDITGSCNLIGSLDGKDYSISQSIDTTSYIPTSGVLPLKLKVVDNADNSTDISINLNVDNILPSGTWTGVTDDINGTAFTIQGQAIDTGTVSGIDKIEAYFVRAGNVYNPAISNTSVAAGTKDFGDGNGSVPYTTDNNYKITIDDPDELGNDSGANGDLDGYNESLTLSGSTYSWWAEVNSTNISDGPVDLHYVVWDKAGNAHHYVENGFIKNNKPIITATTVGTDLDWSDVVEAGEQFVYAGSFNSQNRLYLSINVTDNNISGLVYKLFHGTDNTGTLISSSSSYTIDISAYPDGADSFYYEVTDSDGIITSQLINVIIDNTDDIDPTISIDNLTQGNVVAGHLEVAGSSLHDGPDADVSGQITLTGNAWDNQRIKDIKLNLDGVPSDHVLASWVGNSLVSQDANFVINSYDFSEDTGLLITWTYTWDSTSITGVAGNDIPIDFTVEDFASTPNTASDSMTVDVVPYISRIQTSITDSFSDPFARSADGKYPVRINSADGTFETITVYGYNLNPTVTGASSDVRLSLDPDGIDLGVKKGIGLSYTKTDYKQIAVNMELGTGGVATGNGYLNIFTNGIPSINNINNNTNNSEADYINPNLADDRYLVVWDLNLLRNTVATASSAVYPSMAMKGDIPEFAYVNNAAGYGRARYWNGTTDKAIYNNWDLFTYTDISLNSVGDHAVLYDINVVNGNYGDYNSGNYGGILTSFYYDVPAHNYYPDSLYFQDNHIWLDNLVDTASGTTAVLDRYQNPDLKVNSLGSTDTTRVFYTVYDRITDRILFRTYLVGTNSSIDSSTGGQINDSGTALYTDLDQFNENGTFPTYNQGSATNNRRFASNNNSGKNPPGEQVIESVHTGEYSSVAATADGSTAVVAYYDATGTGNVRLKYNNTPTNSSNWIDLGIIDSGHGGENIDVKIDSNDNIHIAYYDNNKGDLRYAYIPKATAAPTWVAGDVQTYVVDSYFDVGEKLTLELDSNDKPYIAYKGVNRSGKVAWLTGALSDGADSSDQFTGSWEIMILPTQITNTDSNKFCIGVDTQDLPVVGYTNGGIEYIRLLPDLTD